MTYKRISVITYIYAKYLNSQTMNTIKSILTRLGIITGSAVLLPIAGALMIAIVGLCVPIFILAAIIVAFTASNEQLTDLFTAVEVDYDLVLD